MPADSTAGKRLPNAGIPVLVVLAHLLFLIALGHTSFRTPRKPAPPPALRVKLTPLPTSAAPAVTAPRKETPPPRPKPPKPKVKAPPKKTRPAPPKPKAKIVPKTKPRPKPVARKPKPGPVSKPKSKPRPKKKKWVPRSPEEIRREAQSLRPVRNPPPKTHIDPKAIASRIAGRIKSTIRIEMPTAVTAAASPAENRRARQYYDAVGARLYRQWQQPSRTEVGNADVSVTVQFRVRADGTVLDTAILRKSGVFAVDSSVEALLEHIGRLPAFANYGISSPTLTFTVNFTLE